MNSSLQHPQQNGSKVIQLALGGFLCLNLSFLGCSMMKQSDSNFFANNIQFSTTQQISSQEQLELPHTQFAQTANAPQASLELATSQQTQDRDDTDSNDGGAPVKELSLEQFKAIQEELEELVDSDGAGAAIAKLEDLMETQPAVLQSCHGLVHEIGHAAMHKYEDLTEAMKFQSDICGSGYMHGLVEEKFSETKDLANDMITICEPKNEQSCFHGIGHGLMIYTDNNVTKSLEYCDTYTTRVAQVGCAEGVFMENFNTDTTIHSSDFLDPENPFFPCDQQKSLYMDVCYFYAPNYYLNLHKGAFLEAIQWCATAPKGYEKICAKGVGSRAMKWNLKDIPFVEGVCDINPQFTNSCIDGMVSYYIVNFASVEKGRELCTKVNDAHMETCNNSVELRKNWYET